MLFLILAIVIAVIVFIVLAKKGVFRETKHILRRSMLHMIF